MSIPSGLMVFRKHAKKSIPSVEWRWRFENYSPPPDSDYVLIEEVSRDVNEREDLRAVGKDGEMEFYEHVKSKVRLMFVSDSPSRAYEMASVYRKEARKQSFMMSADYDGISIGTPQQVQSTSLPDYSSGQSKFKSVAITNVEVRYVEVYRDNLGVISSSEIDGRIDNNNVHIDIKGK